MFVLLKPLFFCLLFNEVSRILLLDKRVAAFQQANLQFKNTCRANVTIRLTVTQPARPVLVSSPIRDLRPNYGFGFDSYSSVTVEYPL